MKKPRPETWLGLELRASGAPPGATQGYSSSRCCSSEPLSMARFTSAKAPMAER